MQMNIYKFTSLRDPVTLNPMYESIHHELNLGIVAYPVSTPMSISVMMTRILT